MIWIALLASPFSKKELKIRCSDPSVHTLSHRTQLFRCTMQESSSGEWKEIAAVDGS